jgi:putative glycosyltransferase (TIGR04372 family)
MFTGVWIFVASHVKKDSLLYGMLRFVYRRLIKLRAIFDNALSLLPLKLLSTDILRRLFWKEFNDNRFDHAFAIAEIMQQRPISRMYLIEIAVIYDQLGQIQHARNLWRRAEEVKASEAAYQKFDKQNKRLFSPMYFAAIGHVAHMEIYLRAQELGMIKKRENIFVGSPKLTGGSALIQVYRDLLTFQEKPSPNLMKTAVAYGEIMPLIEKTDGSYQEYNFLGPEVELAWYKKFDKSPFSPPEHFLTLRDEFLRKRGLDPNNFWVTLHVRSAGDPTRSLRDATLENYKKAIQFILDRGGYVVRLGDPSMLTLDMGPHVIDLAHAPDRTPELDIAFVAQARFAICVNSGPAYIPGIFDIPALATNWPNLSNIPWFRKYRLLPRHACYISTGKELSLSARLSPQVGMIESHLDAQTKDIRFEENSAEEILGAVRDMFDFPDVTPEQVRGQEILRYNGCYPLLIDQGFLEQNRQFLSDTPYKNIITSNINM